VLNKTISQGRLAMIDMGNNGKVADVSDIAHAKRPGQVLISRDTSAGTGLQKTRDCILLAQ
jgi:surface antigen